MFVDARRQMWLEWSEQEMKESGRRGPDHVEPVGHVKS